MLVALIRWIARRPEPVAAVPKPSLGADTDAAVRWAYGRFGPQVAREIVRKERRRRQHAETAQEPPNWAAFCWG